MASTSLPSLGSMRRSGSVVVQQTTTTEGGGSSPLSGSTNNRSFSKLPSIVKEASLPQQQQQQQTPKLTAIASPSPKKTKSKPALESAEDIEMHYVVGLIKNRDLEAFKKWSKDTDNINVQDFAGNTALHWAAHKGLPEFVGVLIKKNADVNCRNNNGATALHCAAIAGVKTVADMLLHSGADALARNSQGRNFFEVIRSKGHAHLEHEYEELEDTLLAKQNKEPTANTDGWLDASHLGAETDSEPGGAFTPLRQSLDISPVAPVPVVTLPQQQQRAQRASQPAAVANSGGRGSVVGVTATSERSAPPTDLEDRIRALEASAARRASRAAPPVTATTDMDLAVNRTVPVVRSPSEFSTITPAKFQVAVSNSTTPRTDRTISPQRFIGPSGRILCSNCDESNRQLATGYCEECRRAGDACWYCDACWTSEHTSKRTRSHRRGPVPIPQSQTTNNTWPPVGGSASASSGAVPSDFLPFDLSSLAPEARAYLMLQQQLIQTFASQQGNRSVVSEGVGSMSATLDRRSQQTQTQEPLAAPYFDQAMVELNDVREQLEAEVQHSELLIDSTRLQLLEALELRHRSEIETMCWRKLLNIKRPPQIIVVYDPNPVPASFQGLQQQRAGGATMLQQQQAALANASPPVTLVTSSPVPRAMKRNATNNQGIQCRIMVPSLNATTQTVHTGDDAIPEKSAEMGAYVPIYAEDAVEMVHGEKHLPDQPQMLLVRWARGGLESWVPAYEVAHCSAVVAYLSRYDKSFTSQRADDTEINRAVSPMNDTERTQLSQQLAALKRSGTAGVGSRPDSLDSFSKRPPGQASGGNNTNNKAAPSASALTKQQLQQPRAPPAMPPTLSEQQSVGSVLPAGFEPTTEIAVDDDVIPPPPAGAAINEDFVEDPSPMPPPTPDDDVLVRKYEQRLRELEEKQNQLRRLREEQVDRISVLKQKQQLMDENRRADVHRQYEEKAGVLKTQQPERNHPLASTGDRHASLVLQELQQEVLDAERHRIVGGGPSPSSSGKPPLPKRGGATSEPTTTASTASRSPQSDRFKQVPPKPPALHDLPSKDISPQKPAPVPAEPSFEQKINRILYEQYFYNKAAAGSAPSEKHPPTMGDVRPASLN